MSLERRGKIWRVRWKDGDHHRSRYFELKTDAQDWEAEIRRKRQRGELAMVDAGEESLDTYVTDVWAPTHRKLLAPKTRSLYVMLYDVHIAPALGGVALRELTPEKIRRWQSDRIAAGAGRESVRKALTLLGGILQRACEDGKITRNPARLVRKAKPKRRSEVRPLAPSTVEKMRAASNQRNATLLSVLAYTGLRPGEALALRWGDVRDGDAAGRARDLAGRGKRHEDRHAPHGAAAGADRPGLARVAAGLGSSR